MVNDLQELMRQNVAAPPPDHLDLATVRVAGRRRVRRRRTAVAGMTAGVVVAGAALGGVAITGAESGPDRAEALNRIPAPQAPTLRLDDAESAVEGRDYEELVSQTNEDLEADNGQSFGGVTDDGLVLLRDGPRMGQESTRYGLLDPATGDQDWLPTPQATGRSFETRPLELGRDRLVLQAFDNGAEPTLFAYVFDRGTRTWDVRQWPGLPSTADLSPAVLGPDDRLYVLVTSGTPRPDDGRAYHLWSASLADPTDVRDEDLTVGDLAFTDSSMVWTDATDGDPGMVHVRDLATGEERSFDPESGERCNLLDFGVTEDRIVMGQYCGTYDGVRDDRVQVIGTDGEQVVTIQDTGLDGGLDGADSDVVAMTSTDGDRAGTYIYDLSTGRFLRLSETVSSWGQETDTAAGPDQFFWFTPEGGSGATQHLGELLD